MKRKELHHYYHADPLFYKIRPYFLILLIVILVLALGLSVCGILGVLF